MFSFITRGSNKAILLAALVFSLAYNFAFFDNVAARYPAPENLAFYISLAILLFSFISFFLGLVLNKFTFKPILILLFPLAAMASYFMNSYNVIIDTSMIQNTLMTDTREVLDLLNLRLMAYLLFLGLLPAYLVLRSKVPCTDAVNEISSRVKLLAIVLVAIVGNMLLMSEHYTSFIREQKDLRYYMNPLSFIYSSAKYAEEVVNAADAGPRESIADDAKVSHGSALRKLVILVVGEATRADHWALNGYARNTNPALAQQDIVNLANVSSCATSTAFSLPCMFSLSTFEDFNLRDANSQENLLDVLQKAGINVLWRDNNSDSKGVAIAVPFEDYRSPDVNPECDIECRDIGMLNGLDDYIARQDGDIVIVLHQMGNHGPAYYKRYPQAFANFLPACQSKQIESCTRDEIINAYDNALLYSDYFLAKVIDFLKTYRDEFSTSMLYMADHGESLGELGLYLHGLPYALAPEAQTHVASFIWVDDLQASERVTLNARAQQRLSHDNYFHTVLGMLEVDTKIYEPNLDILSTIK